MPSSSSVRVRPIAAAIISVALVVATVTRAQPAGGRESALVLYRDPVFAGVEYTLDIVYGDAVDIPTGRTVQLLLDLYEPAGDTGPARPVLVFAHGGGFAGGDKANSRRWAEAFARRGWVALSIEYRVNQGDLPTVGIPAAVADARQAVAWVRSHAAEHRLDSSRLVAGGSSAGAIAALFMTYTDLAQDDPAESPGVAGVMDLWGGMYGQESRMTAGEPPLIIVHGTEDPVVPYSLAEALRDRAEAAGIPYAFHPLQATGHGSDETEVICSWAAEFFYPLLWPGSGASAYLPWSSHSG